MSPDCVLQTMLQEVQSLVVKIGDFLSEFMEPTDGDTADVVQVNDVICSGLGVVSGPWKLTIPVDQEVPDQYKCLINTQPKSASNIKVKKRKSKLKGHLCSKCRVQFPSNAKLRRHLAKCHSEKPQDTFKVEAEAAECETGCGSRVKNHQSADEVEDPSMSTNEGLTVNCGTSADGQFPTEDKVRRVWTCDVGQCDKEFVYSRSLKDHRAKCKGVKMMSARWKRSPVNGEFMCDAPGILSCELSSILTITFNYALQ